MRFEPKRAGRDHRINADGVPPWGFIAATVDFAMVSSAQRNSEFIANLASECSAWGKTKVAGIHGSSAADQPPILGDRFDMVPVNNPTRLWQHQSALDEVMADPCLTAVGRAASSVTSRAE